MINLFKWCDTRLSQLKSSGIEIHDGVAVLPEHMIYSGKVRMISTYQYRNDISENIRKESLLCNFMPDNNLFVRLAKIDEDYQDIKEYGGMCGQDISPSIGMLRPRQQFSLLINSIYNCCMALRGIKVMPNSRIGDLKTIPMINSFPDGVNIIAGIHGCKKYGFKQYGLYQLRLIVKMKKTPILYVYGTLSLKEARQLFWFNDFKIITFPDRRNRIRNNAKSYIFYFNGQDIVKEDYESFYKEGVK